MAVSNSFGVLQSDQGDGSIIGRSLLADITAPTTQAPGPIAPKKMSVKVTRTKQGTTQSFSPIDVPMDVTPKVEAKMQQEKAKDKFVPEMSYEPTDIENNVRKPTTEAEEIAETRRSWAGAHMILAGAQFMNDVLNANSAYNNVHGQAELNIMMAKNQGSDAVFRGHQAALDRQSEGYNNGQDAELAMAAQGQDVNGAAVTRIRESYEALGAYNGMREKINSMREALGYQLEEINYQYQDDSAAIQRDATVIGSALNFGAAGLAYSL